MSDFVSDLREQLVAAAAREQERRMPRPGPLSPAALVGGGATAVLATLVAVAVLGGLRSDPAPERTRAAAPALTGRALFSGPLDQGVRYRTRVLSPVLSFVVGDGDWFLRRPVTVDLLELERRNRVAERPGVERPATEFLWLGRMSEVFEPSIRGLRASRVPAPPDLHRWLSDHPDLRVGSPDPVTVGDVRGEEFNVSVSFTRPVHADPGCRQRGLGVCTRVSLIGSYANGMRMRMLVLETEPQPLTIVVAAQSADDLEEVEAAADPVLASLRIADR